MQFNVGVNLSGDDGGSWSRGGNVNATWKLGDRWEIQLGPSLDRARIAAQYVTTHDDATAAATYGHRYLFADVDQTTVSLETRLNVTFTPDLSLQVYARPFISAGDYGLPKELRAPRTFDFLTYGKDVGTLTPVEGGSLVDPDGAGPAPAFTVNTKDFNYRSLLGNAVLRWEWSPGSTIFVVWQQSRELRLSGSDPVYAGTGVGQFDLHRDVHDLFALQPSNIFMVKINYWLNP